MVADWLWQGLLFTAFGLGLGLIPAHFYYRKGRKIREPLWSIWTAVLANTYTTNEVPLRLSYGDRALRSVSVSWVMIWNNGQEALEKTATSTHNPLQVVTSRGAMIIDANVVAQTDIGNQVTLKREEKGDAVTIAFDYLNYRQGFIVSIVHSGTSPRLLSVKGGIVNGEPPRQVDLGHRYVRALPPAADPDTAFRTTLINQSLFRWIIYGIIIVAVVVVITGSLWSWGNAFSVAYVGTIVAVIFGGIASSVESSVAFKPPVGLDDIDDERVLSEFWDRWTPPRDSIFM